MHQDFYIRSYVLADNWVCHWCLQVSISLSVFWLWAIYKSFYVNPMITLTSLLSIKDTWVEKTINRYLVGHRWQPDTERASDSPLFQSKQSPCICTLICMAISLLQWAPAWCQRLLLHCLIRISAMIALNGTWEFTLCGFPVMPKLFGHWPFTQTSSLWFSIGLHGAREWSPVS